MSGICLTQLARVLRSHVGRVCLAREEAPCLRWRKRDEGVPRGPGEPPTRLLPERLPERGR
jgi:hypothetical protein